MVFDFRRLLGALALGAATLASLPAVAGPYSQMFVFGDSLSDTGNVYLASAGTNPPAGQPYYQGRFSDGPVWVETLAAGLGLGLSPALLPGGNNFAFAGARTVTPPVVPGDPQPPGLLQQAVGLWGSANPVADPNALYVVVGGGNDMRDARNAFRGSSDTDDLGRQAAAQAAVDNLYLTLQFLASRGAHHVLLSNLPDLGSTPEAALLGLQGASSDVSERFTQLMAALEVHAEATLGLDIELFDMAGLASDIRDDALNNGGNVYGITNATAPCTGFAFSALMGGTSCNVSAFADALHPSARAHAIFGAAALSLVIPEPGSTWLVVLAVAGLGLQRRRAATV